MREIWSEGGEESGRQCETPLRSPPFSSHPSSSPPPASSSRRGGACVVGSRTRERVGTTREGERQAVGCPSPHPSLVSDPSLLRALERAVAPPGPTHPAGVRALAPLPPAAHSLDVLALLVRVALVAALPRHVHRLPPALVQRNEEVAAVVPEAQRQARGLHLLVGGGRGCETGGEGRARKGRESLLGAIATQTNAHTVFACGYARRSISACAAAAVDAQGPQVCGKRVICRRKRATLTRRKSVNEKCGRQWDETSYRPTLPSLQRRQLVLDPPHSIDERPQ
jgi:hypothetical protein